MSVKHNLLKVFSVIAILAMIFSNIQPSVAQAQSGGGERQQVDITGRDGINRKINARNGKLSFIDPGFVVEWQCLEQLLADHGLAGRSVVHILLLPCL